MGYKKINDEVLYFGDGAVTVSLRDLAFLKEAAQKNPRKRIRLCAHSSVDDKIHEMFIVHGKEAYVRPHKHLDRGESFQVLEGEVDILLYDDQGRITQVIEMGDMASGKCFYYRIASAVFHSLRIRSKVLCFKEVTSGPFNPAGMVFASWAPEESDAMGVREFMRILHKGDK